MTIEHEYFGVLETDETGAVTWSDTIEVAEQSVDVEVGAPEEDAVSDRALDAAAALLTDLERYDSKARDALVAELSERGSAAGGYVDEQLEALGESLLDILVRTSGDIPLDVLRSLQLSRVAVRLDHDDDEDSFATLEYSLSSDDVDDILMVTLTSTGEVVGIETDADFG